VAAHAPQEATQSSSRKDTQVVSTVAAHVPQEASQAATESSNRIGLAAVVAVAALMLVAAVWFLGADPDGADGVDAPSPPTAPAVAPSLDAIAAGAEDRVESDAPVTDLPVTGVATDEVTSDDDVVGDVAAPGDHADATDATDATDASVADFDVREAEPVEPVAANAPVEAPADEAAVPPPVAETPDGPSVEIVARTEACRFGSNCLVVGYVAHGFDVVPGSFTCEFASGSRFEFRATSATVDHACATGSIGDSITIEIDGVRSDTVVHD
jgi:hypothetical protein